jgi:uncharacterized membrane protein YqhA
MRTSEDERAMRPLKPLPNLIFARRWLQLPLYLGLIVAQGVYVWLFWQELYYLLLSALAIAASDRLMPAPPAKHGAHA